MKFATVYDRNTFYVSKDVRMLCHTTKYFLKALVEFINNRDVNWIEHFFEKGNIKEAWGICEKLGGKRF